VRSGTYAVRSAHRLGTVGAVPADLPNALQLRARMRPHRAPLLGVALAVLVVLAAGLSGPAHFSGPRWLPNLKVSHRPLPPPTVTQRSVPAQRPFARRHASGGSVLGTILLWTLVAIVVFGVLMLLWRLWAGRRARAARGRHSIVTAAPISRVPVEPEPEPDTPALRTGIELALQILDAQRDPADAVVRAWLGLQETAEESGIVRRAAETPTEFTSRILSYAFADDRAVRTLLRLYLRTRFGDHPATAEDVAAVREALRELVRTWPAPAPAATTGQR
jgi:hypothetical protein